MLLKIDFDEKNVVHREPGRILLKVSFYGGYASGAHLNTVKGDTVEDFENHVSLKGKTILIGQRGGISTI